MIIMKKNIIKIAVMGFAVISLLVSCGQTQNNNDHKQKAQGYLDSLNNTLVLLNDTKVQNKKLQREKEKLIEGFNIMKDTISSYVKLLDNASKSEQEYIIEKLQKYVEEVGINEISKINDALRLANENQEAVEVLHKNEIKDLTSKYQKGLNNMSQKFAQQEKRNEENEKNIKNLNTNINNLKSQIAQLRMDSINSMDNNRKLREFKNQLDELMAEKDKYPPIRLKNIEFYPKNVKRNKEREYNLSKIKDLELEFLIENNFELNENTGYTFKFTYMMQINEKPYEVVIYKDKEYKAGKNKNLVTKIEIMNAINSQKANKSVKCNLAAGKYEVKIELLKENNYIHVGGQSFGVK